MFIKIRLVKLVNSYGMILFEFYSQNKPIVFILFGFLKWDWSINDQLDKKSDDA